MGHCIQTFCSLIQDCDRDAQEGFSVSGKDPRGQSWVILMRNRERCGTKVKLSSEMFL